MAKKLTSLVKCENCKNAKLMQWMRNPVIAECRIHGEREVAGTMRKCDHWERDGRVKNITHYTDE